VSISPKKGNSFCWLPFQQLALKQWNQTKGIVSAAPCCNTLRPGYDDPLGIKNKLHEDISAEDIFYGPEMSELRQWMLKGKKHPVCRVCWEQERRSFHPKNSYRLHSQPTENVDINNPVLKGIDFGFGENCNLRCRMCSPYSSNKLMLDYQYFVNNKLDTSGIFGFEWEKNKDFKFAKNRHQITTGWKNGKQWHGILDNIHNLTYIKATGGETFLTEGFIQFIDTAIEKDVAKNITLECHTNATKFTTDQINKLNCFKNLHITASIDSTGKNYEYIRYPMLWKNLDHSVRSLCKNIKVPTKLSVNVVLGIINAHYMKLIVDWVANLSTQYTNIKFDMFTDILFPEERPISLKRIPPEIKKDLLQELKELQKLKLHKNYCINFQQAIDYYNSTINYIPTDQDKADVIRDLTVFDKSRNQNYHDYLHTDIINWLDS